MARKKYSELTEEQRKKNIAYASRYNREVAARTSVKMSKEMDAAMVKYMTENGYKSKNGFIISLIKKEIGWDEK